VANAIEASPERSEIFVEARVAAVEDEFADIHIRDEGPGIAPALMDKLFQPFFTTKQNGTGLGLANVKKIVELHGGTVHVENPAKGGALFIIRIPLRIDSA
jgi:signal transduction histidine kinase